MQDTTRRPIVVGIDGSEHSARALRWAVREAQLRRTRLELVHAYHHEVVAFASAAAARELAGDLVADVVARYQGLLDTVEWRQTIAVGSAGGAAGMLLDAGRGADMIVMGTRGLGGFGELLLGSTSHRVLQHASVPVALIREPADGRTVDAEERDGLRSLVVGVDGSPEALGALRWAVDEARRRGVGVLVVHGMDLPSSVELQVLGLPLELVATRIGQARATARSDVDAQIDRSLPLQGDVDIDRVIDDDAPVAALQRYATAEHLLVVGTRGRRGFSEVGMGSVSHQCAHHAAGPLVVVPYRPS